MATKDRGGDNRKKDTRPNASAGNKGKGGNKGEGTGKAHGSPKQK